MGTEGEGRGKSEREKGKGRGITTFVFLVNTEEIKTNISSIQCNMLSMNAH